MKRACTLAVLVLLAGTGCSDYGLEEPSERHETLTNPSGLFQSFTYESSTGVAEVERFAECGPDQVMTGFGARVHDDNFTDMTLYCRGISADGTLSDTELAFVVGGEAEEQRISADAVFAGDGQVVIGLGGIVTHHNVRRLVIRQCPWIPSIRRTDVGQCSYSSTSPGYDTTEAFFDAHGGYSSSQKPRVVAVGAGMTSTDDNVYAIRMAVGFLE